MRIITISIIFILGHITSKGQGENTKLRILPLLGDFYVYTTQRDIGDGYMFPSNGMYLVTNAGIVLFDTPFDTTQFQPLLDSIAIKHKQKVIMVIATHYHDDRTAGLEFYRNKGIQTYSSRLTYNLCKEYGEKQAEFYFENDTTFNVGGYLFQTFYPGEGHSKDNIVVWFEKDKILYGGCLVKSIENVGLGNLADANLEGWAPSVKKLIKKYPHPAFVIPGHFNWSAGNSALKHTLKLLKQHRN